MKELLGSIAQAQRDKNWFAALALSLTIPDVCGSLEGSKQGRSRYINWFNKYLLSINTSRHNSIFMSGDEMYCLRCALLHQGEFNINDEKQRAIIDRFIFAEPPPDGGTGNHRCRLNDEVLVFNVDEFCNEIIAAAEKWQSDMRGDPEVQENIARASRIHTFNETISVR